VLAVGGVLAALAVGGVLAALALGGVLAALTMRGVLAALTVRGVCTDQVWSKSAPADPVLIFTIPRCLALLYVAVVIYSNMMEENSYRILAKGTAMLSDLSCRAV